MEHDLIIMSHGQMIGILGGAAAVLGAAVVSLVIYIFNRQVKSLEVCIELLRQEIEALSKRQDSKSQLIGNILSRLDKIEAEHQLRGALCPALHKHMREGELMPHGHARSPDRES